MTFATFKDTPGRQPATVLELDLDYCANSYGISPCTATLALINLALQSEDLSTSWPATELTVTTNVTGSTPIGSNIADRLIPSVVSSANHRLAQSIGTFNEQHTISLFAFAEGYSVLDLQLFNGTDSVYAKVRFELADAISGVIISTGLVRHSMQQVVGFPGWFRCDVTGLPPTLGLSNQMMIYVKQAGIDTADTFSGDGTSGIIAVGAQCRAGGALRGRAGRREVADHLDRGSGDDLG